MAARAMGPTGCQDGKCRANDRRSMLGQVHFPLTILTSLSTYLGQVLGSGSFSLDHLESVLFWVALGLLVDWHSAVLYRLLATKVAIAPNAVTHAIRGRIPT